jgi:hypothetical protein
LRSRDADRSFRVQRTFLLCRVSESDASRGIFARLEGKHRLKSMPTPVPSPPLPLVFVSDDSKKLRVSVS